MALPGDQIPPSTDWIAAKFAAIEKALEQLGAARSAGSTTIQGGTQVVKDAAGNDIVRMGLVPSVFGGPAKPGFDLIRPGGAKVLHYESPGFWALHDATGWIIVSDDIGKGRGLARPWLPVFLTPMFRSNLAAGATGSSAVNVGVLAKWEGRVSVSHPWLEVDGIWGAATGSNTATYEVRLSDQAVGSWNTSVAEVSRKGPFDVTEYMNQDWVKIEVAITASSGTGEVSTQLLGCYLRQT